jgi:hypothetical protein
MLPEKQPIADFMIRLYRFWVLVSSLLVSAGWILSTVHALNRVGYMIFFLLGGISYVWHHPVRFEHSVLTGAKMVWHKLSRRFKRPAPAVFLVIFLFNLISVLVAPQLAGDSGAYRIPRVLHWLGAGGWHWIHTDDSRMNIAACNYEWLFTPLILFSRTDDWICVPNLVSYALLPGLIFLFLHEVKVPSRVAWWWTWILSCGWCFVLQATSSVNDGLGATFALAAVAFACRASRTKDFSDVVASLLAAGLFTGMKQTNLPLVLPWLIALWPCREWVGRYPLKTCITILFALLVSLAPLAYLNWQHTGTWSGFPHADAGSLAAFGSQHYVWGGQQELTSPFWGLLGNVFCMTAQNLLPLVFPWNESWNQTMQRFIHTPFGQHFTQFEVFGRLDHSITTGSAGIGAGIIALSALSFIWSRRSKQLFGTNAGSRTWSNCPPTLQLNLLHWAPWIALLVFMAKVGTYANARQAAPYYVLLFPTLLTMPGQISLTRCKPWQWLALGYLVVTLAYVLIFIHVRHFVPAAWGLRQIEQHPQSKWMAVYGDFFASEVCVKEQRDFLRDVDLSGEPVIGYSTACGGSEPGFWFPLGARRVERVLIDDTSEQLAQRGIRYVVVEDVALKPAQLTIDEWVEKHNGKLVKTFSFVTRLSSPRMGIYLVHLQP